MTLVVEDGTGLSTAESWLSAADLVTKANSLGLGYLNESDPTGAWLGTIDTAKAEAALRRGTQYLQAMYGGSWAGTRSSGDQALDWPRFGVIKQRATPNPLASIAYSLGPRFGYLGYAAGRASPYVGVTMPGVSYYPNDYLPNILLIALVHVALREYVTPGYLMPDYSRQAQVHMERVGPVTTTYFDRGPVPPTPVLPLIDGILRPILALGGGLTVAVGRA